MSQFKSLVCELAGYWDCDFADLPAGLKNRVAEAFSMFPWDEQSVATRKQLACQDDQEHDPAREPTLYFSLTRLHARLAERLEAVRKGGNPEVVLALQDVYGEIQDALVHDRESAGREIRRMREIAEAVALDAADFDDDRWPAELDAALRAWRAVTKGYDREEGTPRRRLAAWVEKNFPDLSKEAIARVATVANWDKTKGKKASI